jgi:hypothetical protein
MVLRSRDLLYKLERQETKITGLQEEINHRSPKVKRLWRHITPPIDELADENIDDKIEDYDHAFVGHVNRFL